MIRKTLVATGAAAAAVLATAGPAAAAGTNMYVTPYSQSGIWSQDVKGLQYNLPPGTTGFGITAVYTGPGWCTAIRYPDNTIQYGVGGSGGTWAGLSSIHGAPRLESWKGCWG
jgi:hypothetical protein